MAEQQTPATLAVGLMVEANGKRLALTSLGEGSPVVILEAGLGASHEAWRKVQPAVAEFTRVISYDRAGRGASESVEGIRSSQDMVNDLHALLKNAAIPGPYVLVGHAFGGFVTLLYAYQYPEEVAGVILVDSTHPEWNSRMRDLLPPEVPGEDAQITNLRRYFNEDVANPTITPECVDRALSDEQVQAVTTLGDTLLVVITAGEDENPLPYAQLWKSLQKEFLNLSTRSTQLIAQDSEHNINEDQPQIIVDTIKQMVQGILQ